VPPDVVTGVDLVVVGVVVVVVGSDEPRLDDAPVVDVVVVVEGSTDDVEEVELVVAELLAPGCSLATTTPMSAVVPVATTATARVRRRSRALARRRASTASVVGRSGMDPSHHRSFRAAAHRTVRLL
jgi:hypothetical protein